MNKNSPAVLEWDHLLEPMKQPPIGPANVREPSGAETGEEVSGVDDEG